MRSLSPAVPHRQPRQRCRIVGAVAAGLLLVSGVTGARAADPLGPEATRKPNVVVIVADDLGYGDVGFNGARDIRTPRLDALARSGVVASNGYVAASVCSPSRAGLMTGRYPQRFGYENNLPTNSGDGRFGLPLSETTMAEVMKQAGYATGAIGKWHLGAAPVFHPNRRGFDEFFGFLGGIHDYFPGRGNNRIERNGTAVGETGYLTQAFGREAVDFIRRHRGEPFFLYLAFNAPHTPLQAPQEYVARNSGIENRTRRSYAAMVSALDEAVGGVADALAAQDLERRTLLIFLSDNGATQHFGGSNRPLKNGKASLFEGGTRVPFFLRWPGVLPAGRTYDQPIISLDILPTAAAAGGRSVSGNAVDGVDLLPFLRGSRQGPPHAALFWRMRGGASSAIRVADRKLLERNGDVMLFNLAADRGETIDRTQSETTGAQRLAHRLADWTRQLMPPLW